MGKGENYIKSLSNSNGYAYIITNSWYWIKNQWRLWSLITAIKLPFQNVSESTPVVLLLIARNLSWTL